MLEENDMYPRRCFFPALDTWSYSSDMQIIQVNREIGKHVVVFVYAYMINIKLPFLHNDISVKNKYFNQI